MQRCEIILPQNRIRGYTAGIDAVEKMAKRRSNTTIDGKDLEVPFKHEAIVFCSIAFEQITT